MQHLRAQSLPMTSGYHGCCLSNFSGSSDSPACCPGLYDLLGWTSAKARQCSVARTLITLDPLGLDVSILADVDHLYPSMQPAVSEFGR